MDGFPNKQRNIVNGHCIKSPPHKKNVKKKKNMRQYGEIGLSVCLVFMLSD